MTPDGLPTSRAMTMRKRRTARSLAATATLLTLADSLMPTQRTVVRERQMKAAGTLR